MQDYQSIWNEIKQALKIELDQEVYESYFSSINRIYKVNGNLIYLVVDNFFNKTRIQNGYLPKMNALLAGYFADPHYFCLITEDEIASEEEERNKIIENNNFSRANAFGLNPNYTFSTFVVGDSNRFAHRYATLAAAQPSSVANPIYIFGDVGLGKTHLMQAIGNFVVDSNPDAKVLYIRTQDFVEDYIKAGLKNGYDSFSQKFTEANLLLVDDIQFLESKKQCQLEFFKIFEKTTEDQKLVVLTSDRRASDLKDIMARLTSRFEMGISLDINKPNKEHRIAILKSKLKQETRNPEKVPDEVIDYIATVCENNIRELEGALKRVLFYCDAFEYEFTLDNAKEALKNLISSSETINSTLTPSHELKKMLDVISSYFKIDQDTLLSDSRKKDVVYARQMCWYLMRTKYNLTYQKIGDIFNGKDHSTVMHGCEVFEADFNSNASTRKNVENVLRKMGKNSNDI